MLAGIVLRWYSASILGKYFTFDVAIQSGQNVIEVNHIDTFDIRCYTGARASLRAWVRFGVGKLGWADGEFLMWCSRTRIAFQWKKQRWLSRQQILACYPQFPAFVELKKKYDQDGRFQSDWYRHYRTIFADGI